MTPDDFSASHACRIVGADYLRTVTLFAEEVIILFFFGMLSPLVSTYTSIIDGLLIQRFNANLLLGQECGPELMNRCIVVPPSVRKLLLRFLLRLASAAAGSTATA